MGHWTEDNIWLDSWCDQHSKTREVAEWLECNPRPRGMTMGNLEYAYYYMPRHLLPKEAT